MSFFFIINNPNAKIQQCELQFEEQPGFTLLTKSNDKKQIRTGIKNSQYLSNDEKETLLDALESGIPLWFKRDEIKQYCRVYWTTKTTMECPPNCKRFATKPPSHAQFFLTSQQASEIEDHILIHLWKISQENLAVIDAAIGHEKTLRYIIKDYQPCQKLPKNAIPLMNYPEEARRKIGKEYESQKYWGLVRQIPIAAVKLPFALLFGTIEAIVRDPYTNVPFILAAGFGLAQAIQFNPAHDQEEPLYPIGPATAHPAYFEALNYQHAAEKLMHRPLQPVEKLTLNYPKQDDLLVMIVQDGLSRSAPFPLLMTYLQTDRDEAADMLVNRFKKIDWHHGAPDGTPILSFVTKKKIGTLDKIKVIEKMIKMGAPIHIEDRAFNPLFNAASNNNLDLVKLYLQKGCKTTIRNGNLLSEAIMGGANTVCNYLLEHNLVDVNQEISFEYPLSLPEKARQVPIVAAMLHNKFSIITRLKKQSQLTLKTLIFYFDDLFLTGFAAPDSRTALQLAHLFHNGSEAIYKKWNLFIKRFGNKLNMDKVEQFIKLFRENDTRIQQYFQQHDVENMIPALADLIMAERFSYVKHLLRIANIDLKDRVGKQLLLARVVDNQKISSSEKIAICDTLINWGAEINYDGDIANIANPLIRAIQKDDLELVLFLESKGGKFVLSKHHALYWAIASDAEEVMDHLLKNVFNINEIIEKGAITHTPVLAIARSKNPHIARQLWNYGLRADVILHNLYEIVNNVLDCDDAETRLADLTHILEKHPKWLNTRLIQFIRHAEFSDPAKELKFQQLLHSYLAILHTRMYCNLASSDCSHRQILEEYLVRGSLQLALWLRKNPTLGEGAFYAAAFFGIMAALVRAYSFYQRIDSIKTKIVENNQQRIAENHQEELPKDLQTILSTAATMLTIYRHIADLVDIPFPTEETALRAMLQNQRTTTLTLNDDEKKLYKRITISDEARKIVTEKLCGFLKEVPKDGEEQGKLLRREIITHSPEYFNIAANTLLISKIDSYLALVKGHKKSNFDGAFHEIKQKNSTTPILKAQQNILDKLKLQEAIIHRHQQSLRQYKDDLQALIAIIQQNKEDTHDDAKITSIHNSLDNLILERETINQWCKQQGVTVGKIKIKSTPLESGKKPMPNTKKRNFVIPQILPETPIENPAPARSSVLQIPQIPKTPILLSREIDYKGKQEQTISSSGSRQNPFIQDERIFYILHLLQSMRGLINKPIRPAKREADLASVRDEAYLLLSKCSGFIHTFCHFHQTEIQEVFPWWKKMWDLRNAILHNRVLWEKHDPKLLVEEFLNTFETPFYEFRHTGFCSNPIQTDKLATLYPFISKMTKTIPDGLDTFKRLESLCLKMNHYCVEASAAKAKQQYEIKGPLHTKIASCILQLREIDRDLSDLKNDPMYSGPQFKAQKRRCTRLINIIKDIKLYSVNGIQIPEGMNIIAIANIIAHETNDFKDRDVSTRFCGGYQFKFEDQTYHVQEPLSYLTLFDVLQELHQESPNPLRNMLRVIGSRKELVEVKATLPVVDLSQTEFCAGLVQK